MAKSRTRAKMTAAAAYLPLSIISIILSRLPPRSISRFKSVSKSWRSLIHHPEFYKQQLLHSNQTNPSFFINKTSSSFASIDQETCYKKETLQKITSLGYASDLKIIGSCNGVICISYGYSCTLCLYNPSTNQSIKLPDLPRNSPNQLTLLGFGYDHKMNKFKVIAYADWDHLSRCSSPMWDSHSPPHYAPISSPPAGPSTPNDGLPSSPNNNPPPNPNYDPSGSLTTSTEMRYGSPASPPGLLQSYSPAYYSSPTSYSPVSPRYGPSPISPYFLVYTLGGTDSWDGSKQKQSIPYDTMYECDKEGQHLNGALHWLLVPWPQCSDKPRVIIISYDLAEEEYREIQLPDYGKNKEYRKVKLGVLGGCLSICTSGGFESEAEIWIMKDYAVEESWEKVFRISQLDIAKPLCLSKEGDVFLARGHDLLLYHPKFDTVTILKCRISDICPYIRSFVPLACEEEGEMITG